MFVVDGDVEKPRSSLIITFFIGDGDATTRSRGFAE